VRSSVDFASDPQRLEALCDLWQKTEREVWITLQGASMCPTILPGEMILVRCHRRPVSIGSIVAYRSGGVLIVHRLKAVLQSDGPGECRIVCQGDNRGKPDSPVPIDLVVGEVIQIGGPALWARAARRFRPMFESCRSAVGSVWRRAKGSGAAGR
jgi:hypothetical protein